MQLCNGDQNLVNEYMKQLFQFYMGTHIDISRHEQILQKAMQKVQTEKNAADENQ